jgi:hypothetical protein
MQLRHWPGSPPAPSASWSLACEDGSASSHPVPFGGKTVHWTVFCPAALPQNRSCHEKRGLPRVYVIIRDGTTTAMELQDVKLNCQ